MAPPQKSSLPGLTQDYTRWASSVHFIVSTKEKRYFIGNRDVSALTQAYLGGWI